MKTSEIVAALAALEVETAEAVTQAADAQRTANLALAAVEPPKRKRRGRPAGSKNAPKKEAPKPAPKKAPAKKATPANLPDKFEK